MYVYVILFFKKIQSHAKHGQIANAIENMCKPLQNPTSTPTMLHLKMQLYYYYSNVCPTNSDIKPNQTSKNKHKATGCKAEKVWPHGS